MAGASDFSSASLVIREQTTGSNLKIRSLNVTAMHPVLDSKGNRRGGFGLSMLDDRNESIFRIQEVSLSSAINIMTGKNHSLGVGVKGLFQQRRVSFAGLVTDAQYVPGRGFDPSAFNGETVQLFNSEFFTFSAGLLWQKTDKYGRRKSYLSFSFFDLNKPTDSFTGGENLFASSFVFASGFSVYEKGPLTISPEVLLSSNSATQTLNAGVITSYHPGKRLPADGRVDLISRYVVGRAAVVGIQWHKEFFSFGISYDFPFITRNAANSNAFELGLELRTLSKAAKNKRRKNERALKNKPAKKTQQPRTAKQDSVQHKKPVTAAQKNNAGAKPKDITKPQSLKESLQQKQDSVLATARAGKIKHEPLILDKVELHFNFAFGSSLLDESSKKYLDELAEALIEQPHLRIEITGHTDNIGSVTFNQQLSLVRANAIRDYLSQKGVDFERIETQGKGMSEPITENRSEEGRAKNRRVELVVIYEE